MKILWLLIHFENIGSQTRIENRLIATGSGHEKLSGHLQLQKGSENNCDETVDLINIGRNENK